MSRSPIEYISDALAALTDFQKATVRAACRQLEGPDGLSGRVLVADEVGLGKTLVARGVVATLLLHRMRKAELQGGPCKPFRVIYICSNVALARENIQKLAIFRDAESVKWSATPHFDRLAELGLKQPPPKKTVLIEMGTLTPGTSFKMKSGTGTAWERYVICQAVIAAPGIQRINALKTFFAMGTTVVWEQAGHRFEGRVLDPQVLIPFHTWLQSAPDLSKTARQDLTASNLDWTNWLSLVISLTKPAFKTHQLANVVRRKFREKFAETCANNLKADIFVLDEFQRFSELINLPDEAANEQTSEEQIIARRVLHEGEDYGTLLLSATPFKALTHIGEEDEATAHAKSLRQLLRYLANSDDHVLETYEAGRKLLLDAILTLPKERPAAGSLSDEAKRSVEDVLRPYICRTERAGIQLDIQQSFKTITRQLGVPTMQEVAGFVALDQVAESLRQSGVLPGLDAMQFHKAAPWSLSFLGGYAFRENLQIAAKTRESWFAAALEESEPAWLPFERFNAFKIDLHAESPSATFRQVIEVAAPAGAERLLWVPPSLPNYPGEGPFRGRDGFSKSLLFSALVLAPRALSSYVSYECERRLLPPKGRRPRYFDGNVDASRAFRFDTRSHSSAWSLVYPSARLSRVLVVLKGESLEQLRTRIINELQPEVDSLAAKYAGSGVRQSSRWYTFAPLLIDLASAEGRSHLSGWTLAMRERSAVARKGLIRELVDAIRSDDFELGEMPADLIGYLADLAIAGPGVCMYRSLRATWNPTDEGPSTTDASILAGATEAALVFIDKMNRVEYQRVWKAVCKAPKPWLAVASYCTMGNLQAVFDEYIHLLSSTHGSLSNTLKAFDTAVSTGAVTVTAQKKLPTLRNRDSNDAVFRCHYAVPLGNQKSTADKSADRITNVRAAFNSPFWPFMLNSTSIGQEGLDFHWYCRRVIHWSLPTNPIDLEQREGRINRYKSLVVRQRVAEAYGDEIVRSGHKNVWNELFNAASEVGRDNDLVPFWHSPLGSACIERVVPAMPFSNEVTRLDEILRILALYRLAFGQPRQQELLENLLNHGYADEDWTDVRKALLIDLAPFNYLKREAWCDLDRI